MASVGYAADPESWEQVDQNFGLAKGYLFVVITNKGRPPFLIVHIDRWFGDDED